MSMPSSFEAKPPVDLSHHYSRTARNRNPSSVKQFYKYFQIPGIGNLAGGEFTLRSSRKAREGLNPRIRLAKQQLLSL